MYPSTHPKKATRSKRQNNTLRNSDYNSSYRDRDNTYFNSSRYDSDIYENEFSRYDDGYDDNYSSPAYSMRSGNFNAGKRGDRDDRNFFERAGDRIREGWRNMTDGDDEDDYRSDWRNRRDEEEEDERYMGRYDRSYPDYRETNSYGRYDRRDTYGLENDRVNSGRGYNGRASSYGGYGIEGPRGYSNLGSEGRSYYNGRNSYGRSSYGGYRNSARKSYDAYDYNNHKNRAGHENRTPFYDDGRSRSNYYNSNNNGYGSTDRTYGKSWRNHFEW